MNNSTDFNNVYGLTDSEIVFMATLIEDYEKSYKHFDFLDTETKKLNLTIMENLRIKLLDSRKSIHRS